MVQQNRRKADFYVDDAGNTTLNRPGSLGSLYAALKDKAMPVSNYIQANPGMAAALGIGGAANLAGLFDNDKIGGQLGGLAGAGALAHFAAPSLGIPALDPQTQIAIALAGGGLGALFDNMRAKKEQQAQYANQINTGAY